LTNLETSHKTSPFVILFTKRCIGPFATPHTCPSSRKQTQFKGLPAEGPASARPGLARPGSAWPGRVPGSCIVPVPAHAPAPPPAQRGLGAPLRSVFAQARRSATAPLGLERGRVRQPLFTGSLATPFTALSTEPPTDRVTRPFTVLGLHEGRTGAAEGRRMEDRGTNSGST
jgi:hypothetical protein